MNDTIVRQVTFIKVWNCFLKDLGVVFFLFWGVAIFFLFFSFYHLFLFFLLQHFFCFMCFKTNIKIYNFIEITCLVFCHFMYFMISFCFLFSHHFFLKTGYPSCQNLKNNKSLKFDYQIQLFTQTVIYCTEHKNW